MKTALLLAVLVIGAGAYDCGTSNPIWCAMKTVGHTLKETATTVVKLGSNLKEAGKAIVGEAVEVGTGILTQGAKAIVGTIGNSLATVGKRDVDVPPAVANLLQEGRQLLRSLGASLKDMLETAISKIVEVATSVINLDFTRDVIGDVDKAVGDFTEAAGKIQSTIVKVTESVLGHILTHEVSINRRRSVSDTLASGAAALHNALKTVSATVLPPIQKVVSKVADLGQQVKEQASVLMEKVKESVAALGGKLSDHVGALLGHGQELLLHGKDALSAAKDALSQIAAQTLNNVKNTLGSAAAVGKDAASVVVDHVISVGY